MKHIRSILIVFLLIITSAYAQETNVGLPGIKVYNFTSFNPPVRKLTTELARLTPDSLKNHPDYGVLPYNAPCKDCFELLDHRTSNTRYFVKEGTNGNKFYSTSATNDLHYKNEKGEIRSIDPRLLPVAGMDDLYASVQQPNPTTLDLQEGFTSIRLMNKQVFRFNEDLKTYSTNDIIEITSVSNIDRNNYTAGSDGAQVINAFPGIDQELIFGNSRIKSNYIMHDLSALDADMKYFVIEDEFILPEGLYIKYDKYEGEKNKYGYWYGELLVENQYGIELGRFMAPVIYDANESDSAQDFRLIDVIGYSVEQTGSVCKVRMIIETEYLKDPSRVFPITIDPTVYGTTATWTGTSGANETPNWCTVTVAVPTPPNATLTGSSIYWEFVATGANCPPSCRRNDLQVQFFTSCDYAPHVLGAYFCSGAACTLAGLWAPTADDTYTADLVECFTPSCLSYNIDFTINYNQFNCTTPGTCVTTCAYLTEFAVTIEGETIEATALAGGSSFLIVTDCVNQANWLTPLEPIYGVPDYTYLWEPLGLTDEEVYVSFPLGTTEYTLTITDACGNTATDVVTVLNPCPTLPIELLTFSGYHHQDQNYLNWTTASEENNKEFAVERSVDGLNFEIIGTVAGVGNSTQEISYEFIDQSPIDAINYYRLKQIDFNGDFSYSNTIAIKAALPSSTELIVNHSNPVSGDISITLLSPSSGNGILYAYDIAGNAVFRQPLSVGEGATSVVIHPAELARGMYVLSFSKDAETATAKFIH